MTQDGFVALPWETQVVIVIAIAAVLIFYLRYLARW